MKFGFSHAGVTLGEDGGSHQAVEDLALMRVLPGMTVLVPSDANETYKAVEAAAALNGPVYIRTARLPSIILDEQPFVIGKGNVLKDGTDAVIFTCGMMVEQCLEVVKMLAEKGVDCALVNMHSLKPFDEELVRFYAAKTGKVFSVEEHSIIGGLGDAVASAIAGHGCTCFRKIGIMDRFGQSGKPVDLLAEYGLDAAHITAQVLETLGK